MQTQMKKLSEVLIERMDAMGVTMGEQAEENTNRMLDQANEMVRAPRPVARMREID